VDRIEDQVFVGSLVLRGLRFVVRCGCVGLLNDVRHRDGVIDACSNLWLLRGGSDLVVLQVGVFDHVRGKRVGVVIGRFADARQTLGDGVTFVGADRVEKRVGRVGRPLRAAVGKEGRDAAIGFKRGRVMCRRGGIGVGDGVRNDVDRVFGLVFESVLHELGFGGFGVRQGTADRCQTDSAAECCGQRCVIRVILKVDSIVCVRGRSRDFGRCVGEVFVCIVGRIFCSVLCSGFGQILGHVLGRLRLGGRFGDLVNRFGVVRDLSLSLDRILVRGGLRFRWRDLGGLVAGVILGRDDLFVGHVLWCHLLWRRHRLFGPQQHTMFHDPRLDTALDRGLGDAVERVRVGGGRLRSEESIFGGEVAEILRDRLHRREGVVESLQGARKRAIGDRQDLVRVTHLNS
jgi:hypothetical protein